MSLSAAFTSSVSVYLGVAQDVVQKRFNTGNVDTV